MKFLLHRIVFALRCRVRYGRWPDYQDLANEFGHRWAWDRTSPDLPLHAQQGYGDQAVAAEVAAYAEKRRAGELTWFDPMNAQE